MRPSCRITIQERNCYCNGPGEWNRNMLQCGKCRRWYHDDCVQCLESPMLLGDKFFVFICSICNSGLEFLARLELKWVDIAHLVLYNLSVIHKKKYFDFHLFVMPFLTENWSRLNLLGEALSSSLEERKQKVLQALQENKKRFKSGKEVKKRITLWCLREQAPPIAPHVVPMPSHTERDATIWEFKVHGRRSKILFTGRKHQELRKGSTANKSNDTSLSYHKKCPNKATETSKCQNITLQNGNKKPPVIKAKKPRSLTNGECVGTRGLLDTLIPILPNYKRCNNPFKSLNSDFKSKLQCLPPSKRRKVNNTTEEMPESLQQCLSNGQVSPHLSHNSSTQACQLPPFDISKFCKARFSTIGSRSATNHLKSVGEPNFRILGRRTASNGKVQFLFEWKT